eukprot:6935820-Alexandrium_andersonii.AAC.2
MCFVALLSLPWVKLCEAHGAVPRLLADDMLVLALGQRCVAQAIVCLRALFCYVVLIGGRVSAAEGQASKTFLF